MKSICGMSSKTTESRMKNSNFQGTSEASSRNTLLGDVGGLLDFPRVTQRHYVINRTEQRQAIWQDLLGSKGYFTFDPRFREEAIETFLFWIAIVLEFLALVISFSKDTMGRGATLRSTIVELLFANAAILVNCYKQWRKWKGENRVRINVEDFNVLEQKPVSKNIHMNGFIFTSNFVGIAMMWCGFFLLLIFDKEDYIFLKNMMYFTGLTIFALCIVDNVIIGRLSEGATIIRFDQMKLLLHELKEELFQELQFNNKYERVKALRDYIQGHELFRLQQKSYLYPV